MSYNPNNPNGQATSANSSPVVLASDQSAVPVSGTFFQTTQPVSAASLPLPSGAATSAAQTTGNSSVASIDTKTPALGQALAAASVPVVLTAAQITTLTPVSTVTANAGTNLNTSALALETGGNLATIATRTPALGQALAAVSVPVILPSATITTLTPPAAITGFALDATLTGGTQQTKITDGTNVATVKAASTAAVATDKAFVVAISPNNTVPVSIASLPSGAVTNAGTFAVQNTAATPAGTNLMGKVGIDQTTVGTTNGVTPVPAASGGPTVARIKAAASTNATSVKASAGQIYGYALLNNTSSAKFFKVYNKASSPTVGTDTPAFTLIIPASSGLNAEFSMGIPLGTGIAYAITGAVTDADTTSTAADDVHGVLLYK